MSAPCAASDGHPLSCMYNCNIRTYDQIRHPGAIASVLALDAERIKANYEMGVLTLTLPKVEKAKPRQIAVEITTEKKLKA